MKWWKPQSSVMWIACLSLTTMECGSTSLKGTLKGDFVMSTREEQVQPARGKVQVGDSAPDFTLPDQSGKPVSLGGFLGKTDIVLYFCPRDDTAVCTAEACAFRDSYELFKQPGGEVIGISSESVESNRQLAAANQVHFMLLSDEDG